MSRCELSAVITRLNVYETGWSGREGLPHENKKALSPFYYYKYLGCISIKNIFYGKMVLRLFYLCDNLEIAFPSRTALWNAIVSERKPK